MLLGKYDITGGIISRMVVCALWSFTSMGVCEVEGSDTLALAEMLWVLHLSMYQSPKCAINVWIHFRLYKPVVMKYHNSNCSFITISSIPASKVMQNQLCVVSPAFAFLYVSWDSPNPYSWWDYSQAASVTPLEKTCRMCSVPRRQYIDNSYYLWAQLWIILLAIFSYCPCKYFQLSYKYNPQNFQVPHRPVYKNCLHY